MAQVKNIVNALLRGLELVGVGARASQPLDPSYYESHDDQELAKKALEPKVEPIETLHEWKSWFDAQHAARWCTRPTPKNLARIIDEFDSRTQTPRARAALEQFSSKPTLNAIEVIDTLAKNGHNLEYTSRLVYWSHARMQLQELLPSLQKTLVEISASGLNTQTQVDDSAIILDPTEPADKDEQQGINYGLTTFNLDLITSHAGHLEVSPRDAMAWLVSETPEGQKLIGTLTTFMESNRQIGGPALLEPLWTQMEPGMASVLKGALGLTETTPERALDGLGA